MPSQFTKSTIQACALSAVSNLIAQYIEARRAAGPVSLDVIQLLRFITLSALTVPPNYHWQLFLERCFPSYHPLDGGGSAGHDVEKGGGAAAATLPMQTLPAVKEKVEDIGGGGGEPSRRRRRLHIANTLTKFFLDCITVGALLNTVAFFVLMGILKGQPASQITANVRNETINVILLSYKIWPVASIINFSLIPPEKRVVWLSLVGMIYGTCLSMVGNRT